MPYLNDPNYWEDYGLPATDPNYGADPSSYGDPVAPDAGSGASDYWDWAGWYTDNGGGAVLSDGGSNFDWTRLDSVIDGGVDWGGIGTDNTGQMGGGAVDPLRNDILDLVTGQPHPGYEYSLGGPEVSDPSTPWWDKVWNALKPSTIPSSPTNNQNPKPPQQPQPQPLLAGSNSLLSFAVLALVVFLILKK